MVKQLNAIDINSFNLDSLKVLKPYFDIKLAHTTQDHREQWIQNLLVLAQHSVGIAHCVQHNHIARVCREITGSDAGAYDRVIGCYSGNKGPDTLILHNHTANGTKHWISILDQAHYAVLRGIDQQDRKVFLLFEFDKIPHTIDMEVFNPIGLEIARPGAFTVDQVELPNSCILGYHGTEEMAVVSNFVDYTFITNYLGCMISLYQDLESYANENNCGVAHELNKIRLSIAALKMMWEDNLYTLDIPVLSNQQWHRRNTQYAQGKAVLLSLITMVLELGYSYFLDARSPYSQRFRDAMMLSSHMKPLYKNAQELNFFAL